MMLRLVALACLLLSSLSTAPGQVVIDLGRGPVPVHVPPSYDPGTPAPLVMMLHGYTLTGPETESYFQFTPLADEYGFLFTAPTGLIDLLGEPYWNATDACCDLFGTGVDDSSYLRALIDEIKAQLNVDDKRVFLFGASNGGFMSHRLACDHADVIAAIASFAGPTWDDPGLCQPSEPVHVLHIHGTADATILYDGGVAVAPYPGAVETAERWASLDGCSLIPDTSSPPLNLDAALPGKETIVTRYVDGCTPGGSAELWTIVGGGHGPILSNDFSRLVVEHLLAHPKPGEWSDERSGLPGAHGTPQLVGAGALAGDDAFSITLTGALEGATAALVIGFSRIDAAFKGGVLVPAVDIVVAGLPTGPAGTIDVGGVWPPAVPPGVVTYFQYWIADGAGVYGFAASNAVAGTTP